MKYWFENYTEFYETVKVTSKECYFLCDKCKKASSQVFRIINPASPTATLTCVDCGEPHRILAAYTLKQLNSLGYRVYKGEKSVGKSSSGESLFFLTQAYDENRLYSEYYNSDYNSDYESGDESSKK